MVMSMAMAMAVAMVMAVAMSMARTKVIIVYGIVAVVASLGLSWALLGSPGWSWALLGAPGRSWALIAPHRPPAPAIAPAASTFQYGKTSCCLFSDTLSTFQYHIITFIAFK